MVQCATNSVRVVILISGRGTNMQALVRAVQDEHLPIEILAILSNRADAGGLAWARAQGLPTRILAHRDYENRAAFDAALQAWLDDLAPDFILLAGFMRVLGPDLANRFAGRIINIHPSLLPAFPGLHTHAQALAQGVQWHGCSVHFVTPVLDHGPIIAQGVIPVLADDTPDTLAARLLPVEHAIYVQVLRWLAQGRVCLRDDGRVQITGQPHRAWLEATQYSPEPHDSI
ncbi:phosphoribosylglycinamide formyltransferase [Castellaniella sp.]|uniref:phosphoribosylglycinamide formyltransferase n=1 Tax=Castellaniella sp. TaxID=1955812 RepID=UPI003561A4C4